MHQLGLVADLLGLRSSTSASGAHSRARSYRACERVDRLGVGRVVLEHLAPQLDADLGLAQALGRELAPPRGVAHRAIELVEQLDLRAHDLDQLLPVAPLLVHVLEARDGLDVGAIELEHARVALDGFAWFDDFSMYSSPRASVVGDLLDGVFDELRLADQRLDDVRPTLEALKLREALVERLELCLLVRRSTRYSGRDPALTPKPPSNQLNANAALPSKRANLRASKTNGMFM